MPDDFSFEVHDYFLGYNSETELYGWHISDPSDTEYNLTIELTDDQKERICALVRDLDMSQYDGDYSDLQTIPPSGASLAASYGDARYEIDIKDRSMKYEDDLSEVLSTINQILGIVEEDPKTQDLPDFPYIIEQKKRQRCFHHCRFLIANLIANLI